MLAALFCVGVSQIVSLLLKDYAAKTDVTKVQNMSLCFRFIAIV